MDRAETASVVAGGRCAPGTTVETAHSGTVAGDLRHREKTRASPMTALAPFLFAVVLHFAGRI
jgi:hypothetical protein